MTKDKATLLKELDKVNKQIETKNKSIIKMLEVFKCTNIDFYAINNDVQYLKDKKNIILFQLASK